MQDWCGSRVRFRPDLTGLGGHVSCDDGIMLHRSELRVMAVPDLRTTSGGGQSLDLPAAARQDSTGGGAMQAVLFSYQNNPAI